MIETVIISVGTLMNRVEPVKKVTNRVEPVDKKLEPSRTGSKKLRTEPVKKKLEPVRVGTSFLILKLI